MNIEPVYFLYALAGYLAGSISTAIITCKLMGIKDPREVGSQNPGATNVLRHGGKKAAIITLLGDMLKGLLPILLVQWWISDVVASAMVGLAAFLGHLYPVYFRFKGGKGVATFFGVLLGFNWLAGFATLVTWLVVALLFKISALSALVASFSSPFVIWYFTDSLELIAVTIIMATLLTWRHRSNIQNMIQGTENKIGEKKK